MRPHSDTEFILLKRNDDGRADELITAGSLEEIGEFVNLKTGADVDLSVDLPGDWNGDS